MYTVQNPAGRLLTIRYKGALTVEEGEHSIAEIRAQFARASGKLLLCGDIREVGVLPQALADRFVEMFRADNPRLERNAMLVSTALLSLQIERMIRDANNPARKAFRDIADAQKFLDPLLTRQEREGLVAFLG